MASDLINELRAFDPCHPHDPIEKILQRAL